ncbi:MAG: PD40 domain-containing protein [Saprospiraceae bacterium]|nr:PD40 domain-containing protein [Saprospiraceae bacterium]
MLPAVMRKLPFRQMEVRSCLSLRSGDLELYTVKADGSDVKQITSQLRYDGCAFFSPDGKKLIFRASRPTSDEDVKCIKNC